MLLIVPVKPHIKEFFQCSHILGEESIGIRRNSRIGQIVAAVFCAYPLQDVDLDDLAPVEILDPHRLHLQLKFPINPALVSDLRLVQLGLMLEVVFEFYAIAFCKGRMDVYNSMNGAAERFTDRHQISTDNYSADAVRKLVDRSTKRTETLGSKLSVREKQSVATYTQKINVS